MSEYNPDPEIPYSTYQWITVKCFDTCIVNFDNKMLDDHETKCVQGCVDNLKTVPDTFQNGQMFKGFQQNKPTPVRTNNQA